MRTGIVYEKYFSEHRYRQIKGRYDALRLKTDLSRDEERFLTLCICRPNDNAQKFFISPYAVTRNRVVEFHDAIIFCLIGYENYESMGIYDENELFDALLLKRNEAVPNSIINPFGVGEYEGHNGSETYCYDFYSYPTKNVLGQRTCLLAVEISQEKKYIYSGPLMGKAMIMDSMAFCYSFVNDSILYGEDYCSISISLKSVKLQCCCAH
uniref:Uncharacterized protein n=1 Tax=Panagrolaimus superbus TaxID=310955 RepID=A0A914YMC5_9BILA